MFRQARSIGRRCCCCCLPSVLRPFSAIARDTTAKITPSKISFKFSSPVYSSSKAPTQQPPLKWRHECLPSCYVSCPTMAAPYDFLRFRPEHRSKTASNVRSYIQMYVCWRVSSTSDFPNGNRSPREPLLLWFRFPVASCGLHTRAAQLS